MPEPRFHSSRHSYRDLCKLAAEFRCVQLTVRTCQLSGQSKVGLPAIRSGRLLLRRRQRFKIEQQLNLASREKFFQRSKQRCGPATNVRLSSDQIRVVTSMVLSEMLITFTDDGLPPRDLLDTVPAVDITVPFFVCSM